jgi:hypothetical protein
MKAAQSSPALALYNPLSSCKRPPSSSVSRCWGRHRVQQRLPAALPGGCGGGGRHRGTLGRPGAAPCPLLEALPMLLLPGRPQAAAPPPAPAAGPHSPQPPLQHWPPQPHAPLTTDIPRAILHGLVPLWDHLECRVARSKLLDLWAAAGLVRGAPCMPG